MTLDGYRVGVLGASGRLGPTWTMPRRWASTRLASRPWVTLEAVGSPQILIDPTLADRNVSEPNRHKPSLNTPSTQWRSDQLVKRVRVLMLAGRLS